MPLSTLPTFTLASQQVTRIGFGAMRLAQDGMSSHNEARDPDTAIAVLRRVVELGINHIDTAQFYRSPDGRLSANDLIRQALHPYPENLILATKIGPIFTDTGFDFATAADMRPLVEANLNALGLDSIGLVYLRIGGMKPPYGEPLAQRFEALAQLQAEGLIAELGLSNIALEHLEQAQSIAPVSAIQNLFNPSDPRELELLERSTAEGIAFVPFGPLGMGNSQLRDAAYAEIAARHSTDGDITVEGSAVAGNAVADSFRAHRVTAQQVAIAHVLALAENTLAIPGTGSLAHLEENAAAAELRLTAEDLALLT